jgi:hypothetical protein
MIKPDSSVNEVLTQNHRNLLCNQRALTGSSTFNPDYGRTKDAPQINADYTDGLGLRTKNPRCAFSAPVIRSIIQPLLNQRRECQRIFFHYLPV